MYKNEWFSLFDLPKMEGVAQFREDDIDAYVFQFDEELSDPYCFSKDAKTKLPFVDIEERLKSLTAPWGSRQIFIQHSVKRPHFLRT